MLSWFHTRLIEFGGTWGASYSQCLVRLWKQIILATPYCTAIAYHIRRHDSKPQVNQMRNLIPLSHRQIRPSMNLYPVLALIIVLIKQALLQPWLYSPSGLLIHVPKTQYYSMSQNWALHRDNDRCNHWVVRSCAEHASLTLDRLAWRTWLFEKRQLLKNYRQVTRARSIRVDIVGLLANEVACKKRLVKAAALLDMFSMYVLGMRDRTHLGFAS